MDAMDGPAWSNTHLPANGGGGSIEGVGIGISIPAGSASASHHINSLGGGHGPGNVPVAATTLTGTAQTSSTNKQGQSSSELASETKRTKRRYDMVERVERLRRDTIDRKDSIYADLQQSFTLSLNAILHQPYPTHPEYLLRLHALSVQRDAELLASRLESTYAIETARQLYHNEVERIQEEFEAAKKAVKEKLLEACDERAKKLREEKDNLELTGLGLDSLFGEYGGLHGKHATRRRGGGLAGGSHHQHILSTMTSILNNTGSVGGANSASATQPASTGGALGNAPMTAPEASSSSGPAQPGVSITGVSPSLPGYMASAPSPADTAAAAAAAAASSVHMASAPSTSAALPAGTLQTNLSQSHISDPFNYSLLPTSPALGGNALHPSMLLLQPNSNALLQSLKTGQHYHGHRTTGGRTKAGYPPNGIAIPPGTYAVMGKSLAALNSLRAEEIADDLEGMRVKKKRGGEGRGFGQKKTAASFDPY